MPGSQPPSPSTSPVIQPLSLSHPIRLARPPRPPRLKPDSRSSLTLTDANITTPNWTDATLSELLDKSQDTLPTAGYRNHVRGSYIDMHKDPVEAGSPVREFTSPSGDDVVQVGKKSGELMTDSTYSRRSGSGTLSLHPAHSRSALRSAFLVLSCAGAMIINVSCSVFSGSVCVCAVIDFSPSDCRLRTPLLFLSRFRLSEKS